MNSTETTKRKKRRLKLYVWEDVLHDYTSGAMFALAYSLEGARAAVRKKCNYVPDGDLNRKPRVIGKVEGFAIWCGG